MRAGKEGGRRISLLVTQQSCWWLVVYHVAPHRQPQL